MIHDEETNGRLGQHRKEFAELDRWLHDAPWKQW